MNSRERFLETMRCGNPDRAPLFGEGIRDGVLEAWRSQGLSPDSALSDLFVFDRREEIELNLYHRLNLAGLHPTPSGLDTLRNRLNHLDPAWMPEELSARGPAWQHRDHVLMLEVHQGLFLSLEIGNWHTFAEGVYLLADHPEFVHQGMMILGEFIACLVDNVLKNVKVDAAVFSEPIGGNHGPLISPRTYEEIVLPSYQPILDMLDRHGIETIIWRTYANTAMLLPGVVQAGFNCLWAVERDSQAMDYSRIRDEFGRGLRLIGGIDLDVLRQGNDAIQRELNDKVAPLLDGGGYMPLADGRVREDVPFDNYSFYRRRLEEIVGV